MKLLSKRLVSLLLAVVMVFGMMPLTAFATEGAEETTEAAVVYDEALLNFEYTVDDDAQTVTLTKYIGTDAAVVVADRYTVDGVAYATVLDTATVFTGNKTITSVTVGSEVAFQDNSMAFLFYQCHKLTSVDMTGVDTSQVTTMESLFDECKKLTTIIGYEEWDTGSLVSMFHTFDQTNSLSRVDLSNWDLSNVVNSGWCFQQCYATQILLPDNLKTISAGFLNHASKVTGSSFTIPAGVEKIGYAHTIYDFATSDFVEFIVAEGNGHYVAIDGILYSADGTEMLAVPRNKTFENNTYEIPEGVTFLGELSFSRNYNIHTLVLPDSFVIEYVPLNDPRYIVFEDTGNINAGTNLSIAIYCYTGITEYGVKDTNPNYTSLNGIIYSKDMTEVVAIPARYAQELVIPEGVTEWNMEAMWADTDNNSSSTLIGLLANCPGVSIPASLERISEDQLSMLNLLYTSRKDTSNPFTITIAEGNGAFELDETEGLVVKTHEHSYENGVCTGCGAAEWDTDGDGVLEILAIGNSFSVDALQYAWQIANDLGIEEIVIGNLYIGGCTLATHATNAAGDLAKYTYYYNDSGTWSSTKSYKISTALESRSWDYVSLQQGSPASGVESSYNEDLTNLIAYVQERSDARLVWHMTWAYQQNSTHSAFPTYNSDQMTMYNAIVSAVENKIVTNDAFYAIIPNGTAVQNSRTSLLGDTTTRDGYHMSYDYGRYMTGLLFIKTVTGLSIDNFTYRPDGVDATEQQIAIESVNNAAANPFAVTESAYTGEVPEEGYLLLETELYQGAYWQPMKAGQYNTLITDASNSPYFFTTVRFTRDTLPVGSIIILADGYQYRPDGWVTDELQTGTRETATTQPYVVVTEEWWGDYTIRSFNVSLVSGGSVMSLTEEEMRAAFRIYVPHTHTYENGTCTICGGSVLDGGYTAAVPENQGVQNAIDRAYSLADVEWTPVADVPGVQKIDGEYTLITFETGKTYKGIPYSGVTANDCYVGLNVSLESYMTALENENSVLYTENLNSTNKKAATYYGTVCSKFVQYALNVPGSYNTNNVANIPGMQTIALPGEYTVDQIKLGDVIVNTATHTTICTGILYDNDGNVAFIEVSEATSPLCRRLYWSVEEFYEHFAEYRLCRYDYIDDTPAAEETQVEDSYALMPRFGNKFNYKVSSTKGIVDVLESGYHKAVILRDGVVIDEITLNGATSFKFDRSVPGYLEMYLEKEDGTRSGSVYACVVKSSVSVADASRFALGKLTVDIDGSCGTPLYVQVGSAHAIFCNVEGQDGTVELTFSASKISTQQVRVAYQNEYGIYLSSWVSFTAEENPSNDPLLSQGKYWNGYNITPGSPTPVVQSNKVGYWSYTMIPVEENTTYYSVGATRLWYLDANGDPISTYNAYKDSDVPFQFTTPEGTAYVSIAYSPNLVEQGTETLVHVHTYENGTCIECGHWNGPVITKQPESVQVALGEKFSVTVEAEGEGLTYQWYYKHKNSDTFTVSSFKRSTYSMTMATYCHNREIYCVITDANGNSVTTDTVTITAPLTITRQPADVQVEIGERFSVSVSALGDGLTYQWYYKSRSADEFVISSFKGKSYSMTMREYCHERQIYCVITDQYGNTVTTDTVTITRPPVELVILSQPADVQVQIGQLAEITVEVQGEGLTYQWYYKNAGGKSFVKSGFNGDTYPMVMREFCHNRQVYCVITDEYGNSVTTEIATMSRPPVELKILEQPADVYAAKGEKFHVSFTVQGEGLTYQWYYKDASAKNFKVSCFNGSTYTMTMAGFQNGRQVYCIITDQYGNQVTTEIATIYQEN